MTECETDDDKMCKPCMEACVTRMESMFTMQFISGMSHDEAHLAAPAWREILCDECHRKFVRKADDA